MTTSPESRRLAADRASRQLASQRPDRPPAAAAHQDERHVARSRDLQHPRPETTTLPAAVTAKAWSAESIESTPALVTVEDCAPRLKLP